MTACSAKDAVVFKKIRSPTLCSAIVDVDRSYVYVSMFIDHTHHRCLKRPLPNNKHCTPTKEHSNQCEYMTLYDTNLSIYRGSYAFILSSRLIILILHRCPPCTRRELGALLITVVQFSGPITVSCRYKWFTVVSVDSTTSPTGLADKKVSNDLTIIIDK